MQTKLLYLRCLFDFLGVLSEVRPPNTLSGKKHADTTALRIKSYLDVNFRTPFSVQDLCAQFFLSQRQLDRIFCRAYGMTVHAYLTELRRHYACALLEKRAGVLGAAPRWKAGSADTSRCAAPSAAQP